MKAKTIIYAILLTLMALTLGSIAAVILLFLFINK